MLRLFSSFFTCLLLFFCSVSLAEEVSGIFSAKVNVYQQRGFDKRKVFAEGLQQVLLKLTGVDRNFEDERFVPLKNIANTLVQEYRYNVLGVSERKAWQKAYLKKYGKEAQKVPHLVVNVRYAQKPIVAFLKRNKIPYWTKLRPRVLLWVLYSENGEQEIISRLQPHFIKDLLASVRSKLALPVIYPYMDQADHQLISPMRFQETDMDAFNLASERYDAYNVVVLMVEKLAQDTGQDAFAEQIMEPFSNESLKKDIVQVSHYRLVWVSNVEQVSYTWESQSDDLYQALYQGMLNNVETILQSLNEGIESEQSLGVKMVVENVHNFTDMVRVQEYLHQLPRVDRVQLYKVTPDDLSFYLTIEGDLSNLKRFIRLKNILRFKPETDSEQLLDEELARLMSPEMLEEGHSGETGKDEEANNGQQKQQSETLYLIYQGR